MINAKTIDELASKLSQAVPPGVKAFQQETEKHFRSILQAGLSKLDVVTRDEFDAQVRVLARTRQKLEELEATVKAMESQQSAE